MGLLMPIDFSPTNPSTRLPNDAEELEFSDEIDDSADIDEMDAVAEGEA